MDLGTMRTTFRTRLSGQADFDTDGSVDARLNDAYRDIVPMLLPDKLTQGSWSFSTVAAQSVYPFPRYFKAPRGYPLLNDVTSLKVYFDDLEFRRRNTVSAAVTGQPSAALFWGENLQLYPTPDGIYSIYVSARVGPSADLPSEGIANRAHAMLVVLIAASEYAAEIEDDARKQLLDSEIPNYLTTMQRIAAARPSSPYFLRVD